MRVGRQGVANAVTVCLGVLPQTLPRQQLAEPSEHALKSPGHQVFWSWSAKAEAAAATHSKRTKREGLCPLHCETQDNFRSPVSLLVFLPHLGFFRDALETYAPTWPLPSLHVSWLKGMNKHLFTAKLKTKIWSPEANTAFKDLVHMLPAAGLINSQTLFLNSGANHVPLADQCFQPSSTDCFRF